MRPSEGRGVVHLLLSARRGLPGSSTIVEAVEAFQAADDQQVIAFSVLGATRSQARVAFETQDLSALEAIAQVGGLVSTSSDPTGVFVFRNEVSEIANIVLGRQDLIGAQRMVYVLNLTEPNGVFMARDFVIRDGDTVYVTEAPFTQFTKVLGAITGTASAGNSLNVAAGSPL